MPPAHRANEIVEFDPFGIADTDEDPSSVLSGGYGKSEKCAAFVLQHDVGISPRGNQRQGKSDRMMHNPDV